MSNYVMKEADCNLVWDKSTTAATRLSAALGLLEAEVKTEAFAWRDADGVMGGNHYYTAPVEVQGELARRWMVANYDRVSSLIYAVKELVDDAFEEIDELTPELIKMRDAAERDCCNRMKAAGERDAEAVLTAMREEATA